MYAVFQAALAKARENKQSSKSEDFSGCLFYRKVYFKQRKRRRLILTASLPFGKHRDCMHFFKLRLQKRGK
ncbi:hypothetical protein [Treponema pedis]|uniref:hypothetical protein n=1 Tax=Treponema pedis TaxID=409322 RepID=UPI0012687728|nr:hypothetical protein [Treponema pedis]